MIFARFQLLLPQRLLCSLTGWLAQRSSRWIKHPMIWLFTRLYQVDLSDYQRQHPSQYRSFDDFFTRELKPGARPLSISDTVVISPVDGRLSCFGKIVRGQLLQAKGRYYQLEQLLVSPEMASIYEDGEFATIYLAPDNYHRVHVPAAADLISLRYVPGRQFSVNPSSASCIGNIYARNERLIAEFSSPWGNYCMIMVGALLVAGMSTLWTGRLQRSRETFTLPLPDNGRFEPGDEFGAFHMGSTVILLFSPSCVIWQKNLSEGIEVHLGEALAMLDSGLS